MNTLFNTAGLEPELPSVLDTIVEGLLNGMGGGLGEESEVEDVVRGKKSEESQR